MFDSRATASEFLDRPDTCLEMAGHAVDIARGQLARAGDPAVQLLQETYEFFTTHFTLKPAEQDLYHRILLDGKIKGRHLGMDARTCTPGFFRSPLCIACCTDLHPCTCTP